MRRKILFLPKWFPNRIVPLNGNFIENHAKAMALHHDIAVLFVRTEERTSGPTIVLEESDDLGFPVVRAYFRKRSGITKLLTPFLYFRAQLAGYKKLKATWGSPELCHVHVMARSGLLALFLKWFKGIPFVISEHWSGFVNRSPSGIKKITTRLLVRESRGLSAVSDFLAESMMKWGLKTAITVIPNAVDTKLFSPGNSENEDKIVLVIANMKDEVKNISGILRAVYLLAERRNDFRLQIMGEGRDKTQLMKLKSELGLDGIVDFLNEKHDQEELVKVFRKCSFLCLFSNFETFGLVLVEALACGKPVVASDLPSIAEYISNEQGLLTPVGDEEALAGALNTMLENYQSYDPLVLHQYALKRFSLDEVGKLFTMWYNSIL